ncbi:nucleotidyltransferase domain-containing protein [Halomicrobium urmianum]|uniref:nucleotidyltransferase domain-containing protein n=1 Tax=Halomicrobium urmianum TaxID=1586233 RepID=UPI001CD9AAA2|nr:nucleotidyltransferase domain-containing protein [Halomicrobium urmianum]
MPQNVRSNTSSGISIQVPVPANEPGLYGSDATDDILSFLSRHRYESFTPRELEEWIDHSEMTIRRAVDVLAENDLVEYKPEGNRKPVQINRTRLAVPDDPLLRVPQEEYHEPVKAAVDRLQSDLDEVLGIVLYGSVARGEADRRSDIDLWVAVDESRAAAQRAVNRIADELEERRFGGERYAFHIAVESVDSIPAFTDDIREIVVSGITVYETEAFQTLQNILTHQQTDE